MRALRYLEARVSLFTALPLASLAKMALGSTLRAIGREPGASAGVRSAEEISGNATRDPAE